MSKKWMLCLTILVLLAGFLPAGNLTLADGPDLAAGLAQGDDFLISRCTSHQEDGAVAYNDDDEYLVVWTDPRGDPGDYMGKIYGQFISSAGVPQGDNFLIRDETNHRLLHPDVAYDSYNQRYLVVWEDTHEGDVEGIVLNGDGSAYSAPFDVSVGSTGDTRQSPSAACYAHGTSGTYVVAYERTAGSNVDIYARLVSVNGGTASPERAVCVATGFQILPDVAVNPANGDFMITWDDSRTTPRGIYGCLFSPTGVPGTEFAVSGSASDCYYPAVAFSPDAGSAGEWLVVFQRDESGDFQIRGRRVTASGTPTGAGIHICDDAGSLTTPDVAYNTASDEFLVVWSGGGFGRRVNTAGSTIGDVFAICTTPGLWLAVAASSSATDPGYLVAFVTEDNAYLDIEGDVNGQRVSTSGTLEGHQFTISAPLNDQTNPAVACNNQDMEYLVVWQDIRAGNADIYGQLVDRDGILVGENLVICSDASVQSWPDVAYNSNTNQYLVVWQDARSGNPEIYGQRVNADGTLSGINFAIASGGTIARRHPSVTHNPINSECLVVYTYETENNNVRGRRVPAISNPSTAEIDIATGTAEQIYPDVACRAVSSFDEYLVVWREREGTQDRDIRGRRVSPYGSLPGGVLDICTQADDQWSPYVAFSPDSDRYLVVWPDDRNSATQGRDIYGRQVSGTGTLYTERAISTAAQDQAPVAVAYSGGLGEYVVTWDDDRNAGTTPDLYAQRLSNSGALLDTTASTNELLFQYSGGQQDPALAWSDTEEQGLLVWKDGRNGVSSHIYGLRLSRYSVFLPLVLRNY